MVSLGDKKEELWQHQGYGENLLREAEKIASEEYDRNKVLINSGIGARITTEIRIQKGRALHGKNYHRNFYPFPDRFNPGTGSIPGRIQ